MSTNWEKERGRAKCVISPGPGLGEAQKAAGSSCWQQSDSANLQPAGNSSRHPSEYSHHAEGRSEQEEQRPRVSPGRAKAGQRGLREGQADREAEARAAWRGLQ